MAKFGIGVVGCGSIANIAHLPSIDKTPDAELVAVCDIDEKFLKQAVETYGAKRWYTDHQKMFADSDDLDAVVIATPNNVHRNQAVAAARAGLHVIVEKPLGVTNVEAWDVVKACRENNVKLMVGCDRRFWMHNQWAKQLIDEGVIGDIKFTRASVHEHWYNYQNNVAYTPWRTDAKIAGGAALLDMGAHSLDLVNWFVGSRVKRVVGICERLVMPAEYTLLDDLAIFLLEYENGTFGQVCCNRYSPAITQSTDVFGTEGTLHTATDAINPFQSCPMVVYTNKEYTRDTLPKILRDYRWPQDYWVEDWLDTPVRKRWVSITPPKSPSNYESLCNHFMECLGEDKEPIVSGEDGAHAVEVMGAIYKSMETGAWVDLPLKEEVIPPHYTPLPRE